MIVFSPQLSRYSIAHNIFAFLVIYVVLARTAIDNQILALLISGLPFLPGLVIALLVTCSSVSIDESKAVIVKQLGATHELGPLVDLALTPGRLPFGVGPPTLSSGHTSVRALALTKAIFLTPEAREGFAEQLSESKNPLDL